MKNKNNLSFIVDISKNTHDSDIENSIFSNKTEQKLFCKCGHSTTFSFKDKRSVVLSKNPSSKENVNIINSKVVKCNKCNLSYKIDEKSLKINNNNYGSSTLFLTPDKESLFNICYKLKEFINRNGEKSYTLYKVNNFALYNSENDKIEFLKIADFLKFDTKTRLISVFINNSISEPDEISDSSNNKKENGKVNHISQSISLSDFSKLDIFFGFFESVKYDNLEETFKFLRVLDENMVDLDEFKKDFFISNFYENYKILSEINSNGDTIYYQLRDSGFGDGKKVKKTLSFASYLRNIRETMSIFVAVVSFPNITTLYLSKGNNFLMELLHGISTKGKDKLLCNANVYFNNYATFPNKIIETTINYKKNGKSKYKNDLKVGNVIYKNIRNSIDIQTIFDMFKGGTIQKNEIEDFFQKYDTERVFELFERINNLSNNNYSQEKGISLSVKHMKHILDKKLDLDDKDYLSTYIDTIKMIDLLEMSENEIYHQRDFAELKRLHDDLTAKYNTIKDKKNAEFYEKAVNPLEYLNSTIGDVQFTVIETLEDLNREGLTMKHCIYSYLSRICERNYLAVHVQHLISNERSTMGLLRNGKNFTWEQLKGYENSRASSEMINAVIKWCSLNGIDSNKNPQGNSDLSPSKSYQKAMSDYLSDKEVERIKKERELKEK